VQSTEWRRQRLLILCYHGISLEDEHQWRPFFYISPELLEHRLEILKAKNFTILPLGEALERLYRKDLPPKSVAITFDDGTYDFYAQAFPRLRKFGFPVTVYLTSYYSSLQCPVFSLICSYMLWKARNQGTLDLRELGVQNPVNLDSVQDCQRAAEQVVTWTDRQNLTGIQKNEVAKRLAELLRLDYRQIVAKRILQVMNSEEAKELAQAGVDFQLHTHRHRMPLDEALFRKEIEDNRNYISSVAPGMKKHFCYPSGAYRPEFLTWLAAQGIVSATTCDTGLATVQSNPLLLPRLLDTTGRTDLEFESWANGIGHFLSSGKRARLAYSPD
jgi:peptidoglycan/xylan/chitin deacetylase (PgdA/CDA1 family)